MLQTVHMAVILFYILLQIATLVFLQLQIASSNSSISSNRSGISDKPERDRRGSLCPVFNDQRAMEMVAKAALAKK